MRLPWNRIALLLGIGGSLLLQGCGATTDPTGVLPSSDGSAASLVQALREGDEGERLEAARTLADEDVPVNDEVVPALEDALDDENDAVRDAAVDALEAIATPEAAEALGKGLHGPHPDVRRKVIAVLRRLLALLEQEEFVTDPPGGPGGPEVEDLGPEVPDASGKPWPKRWGHRLRRLLGWVHHLEARTMRGDCEAQERLEELADHRHPRVRRAAEEALERIHAACARPRPGFPPTPAPSLPEPAVGPPEFTILPMPCGCDGSVEEPTPEPTPDPTADSDSEG